MSIGQSPCVFCPTCILPVGLSNGAQGCHSRSSPKYLILWVRGIDPIDHALVVMCTGLLPCGMHRFVDAEF
jgi:hypothetical protein